VNKNSRVLKHKIDDDFERPDIEGTSVDCTDVDNTDVDNTDVDNVDDRTRASLFIAFPANLDNLPCKITSTHTAYLALDNE
jgi:hypothetical protein